MLLEYTDTKFSDKEFDCGPAPNFDRSCWFDVKFKLGLDFPNLPYYKDGNKQHSFVYLNWNKMIVFYIWLHRTSYLFYSIGDISMTQSNAILRYIARKNDMCGKTEQEKVWVDMMADEAIDFRNGWVYLCYNTKFVSCIEVLSHFYWKLVL